MSAPVTPSIGGDFEAVSVELLATGPSRPPWEARYDTDVHYLQTGRQALAAIEEVLRQEGRRRLVLPEFFCDSMVLPFIRRGWDIVPVPLGRDLFPLAGVLSGVCASPDETVILHVPHFGQHISERLIEELVAARSTGARVVVDETHAVFAASGGVSADFVMASLRKTVPVVDGAYVWGLHAAPPGPATHSSSEVSRLRAEAMAAKHRHLAGKQGPGAHLELFARADELVADHLAPAPMSASTRALLHRLDFTEIARRRGRNAVCLAAALADLGVRLLVDPRSSGGIPSHLVVLVPEPAALQAALSVRGIFCPIHWPRPAQVPVTRWPDRLLSVPIDQRYDSADMASIAEAFAELPPSQYRLADEEIFR